MSDIQIYPRGDKYGPDSGQFGYVANTVVESSPFTGNQFVNEFPGTRWKGVFNRDLVNRLTAEEMKIIFSELRGQGARFLVSDPTYLNSDSLNLDFTTSDSPIAVYGNMMALSPPENSRYDRWIKISSSTQGLNMRYTLTNLVTSAFYYLRGICIDAVPGASVLNPSRIRCGQTTFGTEGGEIEIDQNGIFGGLITPTTDTMYLTFQLGTTVAGAPPPEKLVGNFELSKCFIVASGTYNSNYVRLYTGYPLDVGWVLSTRRYLEFTDINSPGITSLRKTTTQGFALGDGMVACTLDQAPTYEVDSGTAVILWQPSALCRLTDAQVMTNFTNGQTVNKFRWSFEESIYG